MITLTYPEIKLIERLVSEKIRPIKKRDWDGNLGSIEELPLKDDKDYEWKLNVFATSMNEQNTLKVIKRRIQDLDYKIKENERNSKNIQTSRSKRKRQ